MGIKPAKKLHRVVNKYPHGEAGAEKEGMFLSRAHHQHHSKGLGSGMWKVSVSNPLSDNHLLCFHLALF